MRVAMDWRPAGPWPLGLFHQSMKETKTMIRTQKRFRTRRLPARFSVLSAALLLAACGGGSDGGGGGAGSTAGASTSAKSDNPSPGKPETIQIHVLSSKPHLVSGDD